MSRVRHLSANYACTYGSLMYHQQNTTESNKTNHDVGVQGSSNFYGDLGEWRDVVLVSQVPRPSFPSLAVWKSGRGPGIIYHVSDVEGREKVERT